MDNRLRDPADWKPDIDQSVADYNRWYLANAPPMFAQAREQAVIEVADAMRATEDLRRLDADALLARPRTLAVARSCVSPPLARDRFIGLSGAEKGLVISMENEGKVPRSVRGPRARLQRMCDFLQPLLDRELFSWLDGERPPTDHERDKALLVLGERVAMASYLAAFRQAQEVRQQGLIRDYLESEGFRESASPALEMPPGTFRFVCELKVSQTNGKSQKLPVDCVVSPLSIELPLVCIELKSAGDFTNPNKRRKEEAAKHDALKRTHGDRAVFLLQLFGYFDHSYLDFESGTGIDWAWDHRLEDLAPYLGID